MSAVCEMGFGAQHWTAEAVQSALILHPLPFFVKVSCQGPNIKKTRSRGSFWAILVPDGT